ncbi:MAG: metallophosphoesterase [Anaerolineae bacterium]
MATQFAADAVCGAELASENGLLVYRFFGVKILCISDTVMPQMESVANLRRRYADVELVVSCGDLPATYLDLVTSVLNVPLFYVRGNHDERYRDDPPGGENLHGRIVTHKGISFAGLEGSIRYNDGDIQFTDGDMLRVVVGMGPQLKFRQLRNGYGVDVLVTHAPPKGIHDLPDLPHNGLSAFLRFMEWYRPRYLIHGHVHTYDRRDVVKTQYQDTTVLNINPVTVLDIEAQARG